MGSLIALSCFPFFREWSKKLYSVKYGLPMVLPMVIYWAALNIKMNTGTCIIPGINEIYCFTGVLLGATISNAAYNLTFETPYADVFLKIGKKFWILTPLLILTSLVAFFLHPVETAILFTASLIFIFGLFGLVGFIAMWIIASAASYFEKKYSVSSRSFIAILTVFVILAGFQFLQVLIFENRLELVILGLFFGVISLGIFSYTLSTFSLEELGFSKRKWKKQIAYGVVVGLILYMAYGIYCFISSSFQDLIFLNPIINYIGIPVIFAVVASEEFFFRGYTIPLLQRHIDTNISCIISSIFFALYHQSMIFKILTNFPNVNLHLYSEAMVINFIGSMLLSYLYVKKRSLIMPIAVHFTWDLLVYTRVRFESLPIFF